MRLHEAAQLPGELSLPHRRRHAVEQRADGPDPGPHRRRAVAFEAPSPHDQRALPSRHCGRLLEQAGLAHPRLAFDQDEPDAAG